MKNGNLMVIPTDTVYGLAAKLYDQEALEKIFVVKGREQSKQIPILISSFDQIKDIALYSEHAKLAMEAFWPGAITFVLKTTPIHEEKTGEKTIAIRMPNHPLALDIINKNGPLRATSLNKSGEPPLTRIEDIKKVFGQHVETIYEQTLKQSDVSSTVVDFQSDDFKILREGDIKKSDIDNLFKKRINID